MFLLKKIKISICTLIIFFYAFQLKAQVRIGLWEPSINLNYVERKFFLNLQDEINEIDDDKNGVIDDTFGAIFTTDAKLAGKSCLLSDTDQNNLTEHGRVVYRILSKSLTNFKMVHVGFTPLTQYLRESGILDFTIEQRKSNLEKEYVYYKKFASKTVNYFIKQKVQIVNMSFGTSATIFAENNTNLGNTEGERKEIAKVWMENFLQSFKKAFESAPDILFVVAAGNDGEDMDSAYDVPGLIDLPNVICVGALNQKCVPADFTNTGKRVDVYAIGDQVELLDEANSLQHYSGTSIAVPVVTNAAAKILQKEKNLSAKNLKKALINEYQKNNKCFCK